ncbi:MAG: histidine phosphatase family protein, partial [Zetaproteobacteria bacterium]
PLLVEDAIVELAYGDWEGKTPDELMQQYPDLFPRWRANPEGLRPPNGESPEEMRARIRGWWRRFCAEHQDTDTHALIVAHSGTIRMLIAEVLNAGFATTRRIAMPYACWSRIGVDRHAAWLEFHNREP